MVNKSREVNPPPHFPPSLPFSLPFLLILPCLGPGPPQPVPEADRSEVEDIVGVRAAEVVTAVRGLEQVVHVVPPVQVVVLLADPEPGHDLVVRQGTHLEADCITHIDTSEIISTLAREDVVLGVEKGGRGRGRR